MGHMRAMDAAGIMTDMAGLDAALRYHLTANHFPPVPAKMIDPCKEAIDAMVDEDYEREIDLPEGIFYLDRKSAPAHAIAQQHHLEAFIEVRIMEDDES